MRLSKVFGRTPEGWLRPSKYVMGYDPIVKYNRYKPRQSASLRIRQPWLTGSTPVDHPG